MDPKMLLIIFASAISFVLSIDLHTESLVVTRRSSNHRVSRSIQTDNNDEIQLIGNLPKIYEMLIVSNVSNRYATTVVSTKVKNVGQNTQEATFAVLLPEKAFISKFVMNINGKDYEAYIKEKEEAKQIYQQAVDSGLAAAHVKASVRDSNRFTVSVNIEPASKATFHLTYEQLLERKGNKYELVINIHPKQPVKKLFVDVHINESLPLRFVHAPPIRSGNDIRKVTGDLDPRARIEFLNEASAHVTFKPNIKRQKEIAILLDEIEAEGMSGQFIVEYDVKRNPNGGEVLLDDGYFIHFFAPNDTKSLPKNVFFVLDTSGSMDGQKIKQLKVAMKKILMELKPHDKFSIIEFNSIIKVLDVTDGNHVTYSSTSNPYGISEELHFPNSSVVTADTIGKAKKVVNKLSASGLTNIEGAFKVTLHMIDLQKGNSDHTQPLIIFLTDGDATYGITDNKRLIDIISERNQERTPIYCLSFGDGPNRQFLRKLSLKNDGFSKHIYEAGDASFQLEGFYSIISTPILRDIKFKYIEDFEVTTKTTFPMMYNGSEIVIAGKIGKQFPTLPTVTAQCVDGFVGFVPEVKKPVTKLERVWAYVTIQHLLEKKEIADNQEEIERKILEMALKYSFVTPVTSLVVVKPNSTHDVSLEAGDNVGTIYPGPLFSSPIASRYFPPRVMSGWDPIPGPSFHMSSATFHMVDRSSMFPKRTYLTTTLPPPSPKTIYTIEDLKRDIPWLNSVLENGILRTEKGRYKIGLDKQSPGRVSCPLTPQNGTGHCKHLHDCPDMLSYLTSVETFERYRCDLQGYAAICCPYKKL